MKRLLLLSFGLLFSATLGVTVSRYALAFTTTQTVTDRIFSEAGFDAPSENTDPKSLEQLALSADFPFENLYLYMYQNVLNGPQEAAIKILSTQYLGGYQFHEDELRDIVLSGSTGVIMDRIEDMANAVQNEDTLSALTTAQEASDVAFQTYLDENSGLSETTVEYLTKQYEKHLRPQFIDIAEVNTAPTQADILLIYTEVLDAYQKEMDIQRENRKLAYQALASEMFWNNNLGDSANVDLLYDLDLVHYVLFGEYITYPDRSGSEEVNLASLEEDFSYEMSDEEIADGTVTLAAETSPISPYTCLDDFSIREALDLFASSGSGGDGEAPNGNDLSYPNPEEIAHEFEGEDEGSDERIQTAEEAVEAVNNGLATLGSLITALNGTKGDWTRSLPCGDVFCITVKLVDENEDPVVDRDYEETEDCVACHIAYINQALSHTVDHSLVPGKVSTNWFEDATCKQAGNEINLDFNVFTVKKSIDLDPGDDIVDFSQKDVNDLRNSLMYIGAFPQPGDEGKTPSSQACKSLIKMNELIDGSRSLQEVQTDCTAATNGLDAVLRNVYDQSEMNGLISTQSTLYEQVGAELYKMALTFRNFRENLQATYLGENAPLPALLAKKYCE